MCEGVIVSWLCVHVKQWCRQGVLMMLMHPLLLVHTMLFSDVSTVIMNTRPFVLDLDND